MCLTGIDEKRPRMLNIIIGYLIKILWYSSKRILKYRYLHFKLIR